MGRGGAGGFGTCSLERVCLVQGQTLRPKTRVKCDWWKMDTESKQIKGSTLKSHDLPQQSGSRHHVSQTLVFCVSAV